MFIIISYLPSRVLFHQPWLLAIVIQPSSSSAALPPQSVRAGFPDRQGPSARASDVVGLGQSQEIHAFKNSSGDSLASNLGRNHQRNPPTFSFHLHNSVLSNVNILYLSHVPDSTFFCQSTNGVLINILKIFNTSDQFKL